MIPIRPGKEVNIKKLNSNNLQYGIYNDKLEGDIIRNGFAFNKLNYYTHYCVEFNYAMQQKYGEDKIKITLLHHNSYNALLWDKTDLISSREIFSVWSLSLTNLKVKCPKQIN